LASWIINLPWLSEARVDPVPRIGLPLNYARRTGKVFLRLRLEAHPLANGVGKAFQYAAVFFENAAVFGKHLENRRHIRFKPQP
jgi:hypothetical protein